MELSKKIRVLIADDESLISDVIQQRLEESGYAVAGRAGNGQQAVELAQSVKPDIILMDIRMPVMDGLEATKEILEKSPAPVILLTAHDDRRFIDEASAAGAAGYLVKPSSTREIDRAITIGLARFKDMMELRRLNAELQAALENVRTLSGLLPICAWCKKIRTDEGYWQTVETFISNLSGAKFSHSICPDCHREQIAELKKRI
ncbi:MAG: response regulator [Bacteroidota bacterium]|jgi:AmiR/NasT family two-component response regulator